MKLFKISAIMVVVGSLAVTILTVGCSDRSKGVGGGGTPPTTSANACSLANPKGECKGDGETCINGVCVVVPAPVEVKPPVVEENAAETEDPPVVVEDDNNDPGDDVEDDPGEEEGDIGPISPVLLECLKKPDCLPQPVQVIEDLIKPPFIPYNPQF